MACTEEEMDDIEFNKSEWIGNSRLYNAKTAPLGLIFYLKAQQEFPDDVIDKYIPGPLVTVKNFVNISLPKISYGLTSIKPQDCFTNVTPNNIENLDMTVIPSLPWVDKLNDRFDQAVLDGMKSVVNPEHPGVHLPLWIIGFWKKMHKISDIQQGWKESLAWLEDNIRKEVSEVVMTKLKEAERLVYMLRWDEETDIPGGDNRTTTFVLASYLSSNCMMNDTHINMMFAYLADRVQEDDNTDAHVIVEGLRFMVAIEKATRNEKPMKFLRALEKRIREDEVLAIEFPVFMEAERHWVAVRIDFDMEEISFGVY